MTTLHADNHDLDKLVRWHQGLSADQPNNFPIHAIFLVTEDDRTSHDIFRRFRAGFEAHGAQFHHLVIFGQHGSSSTLSMLMDEFGLATNSTPVLVLVDQKQAANFCVLPLPAGVSNAQDGLWAGVLNQVEGSTVTGEEALGIDSLPDLTFQDLGTRALVAIIGGVLDRVNPSWR